MKYTGKSEMISHTLSSLLSESGIKYELHGSPEKNVTALEYDSRKNFDDSTVFFCLTGAKKDGHEYARSVYDKGGRIFAAERLLPLPDDAVQIIFTSSRDALAYISDAFYSHPSRTLKVIGVTGTKGKTTTSVMIEKMMLSCGMKCGYIGSNGVDIGEEHFDTPNTTPESIEIEKYFAMMLSRGFTHAVIEVSSQALIHSRVLGISFDTVVYANLSPDHISPIEHPTFEAYRDAKHKLFTDYDAENIVVNRDDENAAFMLSGIRDIEKRNVIGYSVSAPSDYTASDIRPYRDKTSLGIDFDVTYDGVKTGIRLKMPGEFSVHNALAAIAVCGTYGIGRRQAATALAEISINGRSEIVDAADGITFVVDYAHNGLSLMNELSVLKAYVPKRLICVFGCVGGKAYNRRRELAEAASSLADFTVITSDNPDYDDPEEIISDVLKYFDKSKPYTVIPDREEAIRFTVRIAEEDDIVLFAGKGHETYQLIRGEKVPFSERSIILDEAAKLAPSLRGNAVL